MTSFPFRLLLIGGALFLAGCATHLNKPAAATEPPTRISTSFTVTRDVIYTPAGWPAALPADLYVPALAATAPRPAVLLLHGGGWTNGDRRWHMSSIAENLARRGYVVLNATYRTTPDFTFPAPVEDLREAVKWLRTHAAAHGIDPRRIATFGYSAGGHLAALVGLMDGPPETRIQAIVAGGAPADLTFYKGGDLVPLFLGGTQAEVPARFRDASPVNHVSAGDPPVFLYHGRRDMLVPPAHAEALAAALTRAGVHHELYWLGARAHFTAFIFEGGSERAAIDFLDRVL